MSNAKELGYDKIINLVVSSSTVGLPIGKAMAKVKNAIKSGRPFTCEG